MSKVNESMGLAGMNPVVGMAGPYHGSFIVNVMNHDKDLGDDPQVYTGLARSLDMDDNLYGIDDTGRFYAKKKYEVMHRKDIVEVYKINSSNVDTITESIIRECLLPYNKRPVHNKSYLYEAFTGRRLLNEDQFYLDPIFEKVELEKMSAGLNGVVSGNDRTMNMQHKGNKKAGYIPDNDYPSGTEHLRDEGYALESFSIQDKDSNDFDILEEIAKTKVEPFVNGKHLIPYKCEVKPCYHTLQGRVSKPLDNLVLHANNKRWRVRAELLLMKEDQIWLMKENKVNHYGLRYKLPGGGIDDPKEFIEDACIRETEEEILIIPKNVYYTGEMIKHVYSHVPEWHKQTLWLDGIKYDGSISFICIGEYDKPYTKYVKRVDRMTDMVEKGKFYKYNDVKDILHKQHKRIIEAYLKDKEYM